MRKVRGVTVQLNDATEIVWTSPYNFYHYDNKGHLIDSSRRKSGKTVSEAHQYCDANEVKTTLAVLP